MLSIEMPTRSIGVGVAAHKDLLKCLTKNVIENGVKNRIYHRTCIAEPGNGIEYPMLNVVFTVATNRWQ